MITGQADPRWKVDQLPDGTFRWTTPTGGSTPPNQPGTRFRHQIGNAGSATLMYCGAVNDYPASIVPVNHVEPAPRRVRGFLGNELIFDTTSARYVWEIPHYPQYYIPLSDIDARLFLIDENAEQTPRGRPGRARGCARAGSIGGGRTVRVYGSESADRWSEAGTAHFAWGALDAWYEEDEQVFVHPRSPYTRVDALRSHRRVRVSLDGVTLADTTSPVLVFETGLPTRYYIDRTDIDFRYLVPSDTQTACPYKGVTSGYWSVRLEPDRRRQRHPSRTWPGPTTSRPASCCPSPGWSPLQREARHRSRRPSAAPAADAFLPNGPGRELSLSRSSAGPPWHRPARG